MANCKIRGSPAVVICPKRALLTLATGEPKLTWFVELKTSNLTSSRCRSRTWNDRLVGGWHDWIDAPEHTGDLLAEAVLGARAGEVLACDSATVNLYKLVHAALDARPSRRVIVSDRAARQV